MGLRDAMFGRKKLKGPAKERLFALSTAQVTLDVELGLKSSGAAAVVFKSQSSSEFVRSENEIQQLLEVTSVDSGSKIERKTDSFGFEWLIVRDPDIEDLVTTVHLVGSELQDRGFGEQLLAAVFKFDGGEEPGLLDLRLQARRVLAVRPARRAAARQRRGARAEGEARAGASDRAGSFPVARALRRAALAAAAAALAALAVASTVSLGSGGIRDESFHSSALRGTVRFAVHLPRGYAGGSTRYPVVYFLHGLPASPGAYRGISFIVQALQRQNLDAIVVAPQGVRDGDNDPEYLDWGPGRNWETALARELPRVVDARYRTIPTRRGRAIIGVSAGGYGAMLLGLHNLGTFGAIESWSGYFHPTDPTGWHALDLRSPSRNAHASAHSGLVALHRAVAANPTFIGFYVGAADARFRAENVQLDRELGAARIPHVFRVYPGGHGQRLWAAQATQLARAGPCSPAAAARLTGAASDGQVRDEAFAREQLACLVEGEIARWDDQVGGSEVRVVEPRSFLGDGARELLQPEPELRLVSTLDRFRRQRVDLVQLPVQAVRDFELPLAHHAHDHEACPSGFGSAGAAAGACSAGAAAGSSCVAGALPSSACIAASSEST